MTAVCPGGGPSGPKPGYGVVTALSSTLIGLAIDAATDSQLGTILGSVIAGELVDLSALCETDPPADPGLTQQDVEDALNVTDITVSQPAIAKARQWFLSHYWWLACQCTQGNTPAPPALSAPGGTSSNAGLPPPGFTPCWQQQSNYSVVNLGTSNVLADITSIVLPKGEASLLVNVNTGVGNLQVAAQSIPKTWTALQHTATNVGATTPSGNTAVNGNIVYFSSTGASEGGEQLFFGQAGQIGPGNPNYPIPSAAAYFGAVAVVEGDTSVANKLMNWDIELQGLCAASGAGEGCCPPDPTIDARFNQVIGLLNQLLDQTPAQQFTSWKDGPRHSNLGEAGSIALGPGAVGVRAEIHGIPPNTTTNPGDPNFYWNLGFITPLALDVPLRGARLVFNPQSFQLPQVADGVAYTLLNGVVIDLVELLPVTA